MSNDASSKGQAVTVEVSGLRKAYEGTEVLKGVDFKVEAGEIFVIMGPSGCGKSVLLKSIIGLEQPDAGRVLIDGKSAHDLQTHEDLVTAIVFQAGALFNSLSVFDNLAFYPREHRLCSGSTLEQKVMHTLKLLSIEAAAEKMPSELSGGMRKRVAIARALMMEPQLLLYDEPTSELDPMTAASIAEVIGNLPSEINVTSIIVSHDRDLSMSIGQRVAMMMQGNIHRIDTPRGIEEKTDRVVDEFLYPIIDIKNPRFKQTKVSS